MIRDVYSLRDYLNLLDYGSAITNEDFKVNFKRKKEKASFFFKGEDGRIRTASVYRTTIPGYDDVRFIKFRNQLHYLDETSVADSDSPFDTLWLANVLRALPKVRRLDEYAKLLRAERTCHTIEIREKATGKEGVANTCPDGVQVFYGADDGSDDKTISADDFSRDFEITKMLKI